MMNNYSPLLQKHVETNRFINNISITQRQEKILLDARKIIRSAIRAAFSDARNHLMGQSDIQEKDIEWISKLIPKFMTQGSFAYRTLNFPCHQSQEMDLDDGVYLPMSILKDEPEANKEWFFKIVDGALIELCAEKGWEFDKKDTCARVIIPKHQAHIDVPLYAVPDDRHIHMTEAVAKAALKLSAFMHDSEFRDIQLYMLDSEQVYLATRKAGWRKSDPLLIANWFKGQIDRKGERLRRICRFLKAWRDYIWESGGPSSLTLMALAAEAYPRDDKGRDDFALLKVVEALPGKLIGQVPNPASPDEILYPRNNIDQVEIATRSQELLHTLQATMSGSNDKQKSVNMLIERFGTRMPNKPEWIMILSTAAVAVQNTPAIQVKPKPIPNMRSA